MYREHWVLGSTFCAHVGAPKNKGGKTKGLIFF
jgi:hypothetical protein